jgi:hypothetical protein
MEMLTAGRETVLGRVRTGMDGGFDCSVPVTLADQSILHDLKLHSIRSRIFIKRSEDVKSRLPPAADAVCYPVGLRRAHMARPA